MKRTMLSSFCGAVLFVAAYSQPCWGQLECELIGSAFEEGVTYTLGDAITEGNVTFSFEPINFGIAPGPCAPPQFVGSASVGFFNQACSPSGFEMMLTNLNLRMDFATPVDEIEIHFADYGAWTNLEVNGQCWMEYDLPSMPSTLGGATITVTPTTGSCGILTVTGTINTFTLAGQEFFLWGEMPGANAICCPNVFEFTFSTDVGSDTELSDPTIDGNEGFDPGDLYFRRSGPVTPPFVSGGRDGFIDDATIFAGVDPHPASPYAGSPSGTAIPVGNGCSPSACYNQYFDQDGTDMIGFKLQDYVQATAPLLNPLHRSALPSGYCVHPVGHLAVSFDDDHRRSWSPGNPPRVPVEGPSPAGWTYGNTFERDEVIGVNVPALSPTPLTVSLIYPVADEGIMHADLLPNPDGVEAQDDDVDALDAQPGAEDWGVAPTACQIWLFSADHEAHQGVDPGDIYDGTGGAITKVIDEAIHLGVPEETDIDAFELAWLAPDGDENNEVLVLLFSVDDDDPRTGAADESGGLDPNMIYFSYLDGTHEALLDAPLEDDVDAITNWCTEYTPRVLHCADMGGSGSCFSSASFGGYIDPRGESSDCASLDEGIDQLAVQFNQVVFAFGGADASDADFDLTETGGTAPPTIATVNTSDARYFEIDLDRIITLKEWTTIQARVENASGIPIVDRGDEGYEIDEFDRIDVGFLPGDVDQNEAVQPFDILRYRLLVLGLASSDCGCAIDFVDINRDGSSSPFDLLRLRQLVRGDCPATQSWSGATMNNSRP